MAEEKTDKPADKPSGTELLTASVLTLSEGEPAGRVKLEIRGETPRSFPAINALPAFPLTLPSKMVQLYAAKDDGSSGDMIGILEDAAALPREAQALIVRLVRSTRMLPVITRIEKLLDEWHAFHWHVVTDRGPCEFFSGSPREAIQYTNNGQLIVEDLAGNQYTIVSRASLDEQSRTLLERAS